MRRGSCPVHVTTSESGNAVAPYSSIWEISNGVGCIVLRTSGSFGGVPARRRVVVPQPCLIPGRLGRRTATRPTLAGMRGDGGRVRIVLVAAALVVVLAVVAGVVVWQRSRAEQRADEAAASAAQAVAAALANGELADAPVEAAAAAPEGYAAVVAGLSGVTPEVEAGTTTRADRTATTPLTWTWPFGPDGWSYTTELELSADDEGVWTAAWSPALVHPDLGGDGVLASTRTTAPRAGVVRPDGSVVVGDQPVVRVGVQPSRVTDLASLTATLVEVLDVDGADLTERVSAAAPDAFVDVITLRQADYEAVKSTIQPLPGTVFAESTLPLAPTREFARALLGTVGPATAEVVEQSRRTRGGRRPDRPVRPAAPVRRAARRHRRGHRRVGPGGGRPRDPRRAVHGRAGGAAPRWSSRSTRRCSRRPTPRWPTS